MIKTVGRLLAGVLAASAWTVNAEAQGNGNPTGGKFAVEHPRRNEGMRSSDLGTGQAAALISCWFRKAYMR